MLQILEQTGRRWSFLGETVDKQGQPRKSRHREKVIAIPQTITLAGILDLPQGLSQEPIQLVQLAALKVVVPKVEEVAFFDG